VCACVCVWVAFFLKFGVGAFFMRNRGENQSIK